MINPVHWYDRNADSLTAQYESVSAETVHGWLSDLLPGGRAAVLDVGAGSGRDAAWLASNGYDVVAVEPAAVMRAIASRLHTEANVQWLDDTLPDLKLVARTGLSFDVILLSAVWMHVAPSARPRAFRKLITLLKPGGMMVITLRNGAAEPERDINPVSLDELQVFARDHGAFIERTNEADDHLGRADVSWTQVSIRLPDDGTGALPLLRHVILNDDKSSTYKLALLRTLCRIADGASGSARHHDDDVVAIPLGLVALTWIRLFKPLLAGGYPQSPTNVGYSKLGFVKDAFRNLDTVSHLDLRIGMHFSGRTGAAVHQALKDAAATITRMPARYMTYPNGGPIVSAVRTARTNRPAQVLLDDTYLSSFGELLIPLHVWRAMQRFDVWIEPALVAEWCRLIMQYAAGQDRRVNDAGMAKAMAWGEPTRSVRVARDQAERIARDRQLFCVWTGKRLSVRAADIDHCLPWSAWPCSDLWNLLAADRGVNQRSKRERLPTEQQLRAAQDRIVGWWNAAYTDTGSILAERFWLEAVSSLPAVARERHDLGDVYDALCLQRVRLKQDQQVPEWGNYEN